MADRNGLSSRIFFHNTDARNLEIHEKADVIVSELIGHLAIEEGVVETISVMKERLLKPNGSTIPSKVSLKVALVSEKEINDEYINS